MKTLAKRLKREQKKTRECTKRIEKLEALNRQAEKMIHERDRKIAECNGMISASNNYIYALADLVGKDKFILPFEMLNRCPTPYGHDVVKEGIMFIRVTEGEEK